MSSACELGGALGAHGTRRGGRETGIAEIGAAGVTFRCHRINFDACVRSTTETLVGTYRRKGQQRGKQSLCTLMDQAKVESRSRSNDVGMVTSLHGLIRILPLGRSNSSFTQIVGRLSDAICMCWFCHRNNLPYRRPTKKGDSHLLARTITAAASATWAFSRLSSWRGEPCAEPNRKKRRRNSMSSQPRRDGSICSLRTNARAYLRTPANETRRNYCTTAL